MKYEKVEDLPAELPLDMTNGDLYGPAMDIEDQSVADGYLDLLYTRIKKIAERDGTGQSDRELLDVVRSNLGYWAGYYSEETRRRVERLFKCSHPIFGAIAEVPPPSPEEAFQLGQDMAKGKIKAV